MKTGDQFKATKTRKIGREPWGLGWLQLRRTRGLSALTGLVGAVVMGASVKCSATLIRDESSNAGTVIQSLGSWPYLSDNKLILALATLAALSVAALLIAWRQVQRSAQAQKMLAKEVSFRRAMENSILIGMRALDMSGRITYVNAAFCQMTGWSEQELMGQSMPFSFWPQSRHEELVSRLHAEFNGKTTLGGFRTCIQRKDGSSLDVRIYISPLKSADGQQTGWMTSMVDITEPNRIRTQLQASHERFSFVLDSLESSVSVAVPGSNELLFANRLYRTWFSHDDAHANLWLAAQAAMPKTCPVPPDADIAFGDVALPALPCHAEVFVAELNKWLEIRFRQLDWADGRIALMVIATDVTLRHLAEEQAALHAERVQTASRLITMGEMASSVAHELNQPLTAIANYCSGVMTRVRNHKISEEELLNALGKTSHQAQRAGQIIQRVHSFVKKSEPNRTLTGVTAIVNEAVELAQLELHRRNVQLSIQVEHQLPLFMVDPILIEQVLINLLRNAAESIDQAARPIERRHIWLSVDTRLQDNIPGINFSVRDTGMGLAPEVAEHLFDAFFSTKPEGLGIGLNLCRSIVESHQGRMHAENLYSNEEEITGCQFTVWMPLKKTVGGTTNNKREAYEPDTKEHHRLSGGR